MPRAAVRSTGRTALVVDAEDRFTTMLAHQLRHLGLEVEIAPWSTVTDAQLDDADLVVSGPGPGDPREPGSPRMRRMREVVAHRRASGRPLLAVCLSHQILADSLGIELAPLAGAAPGTAADGRHVRDAGIHRLLQHVHRARRARHRRGSARPRSPPMPVGRRLRAARARATRRCRATSSRSCRGTA